MEDNSTQTHGTEHVYKVSPKSHENDYLTLPMSTVRIVGMEFVCCVGVSSNRPDQHQLNNTHLYITKVQP